MEKMEELYQSYFKDVYLYVKALSKDCFIAEEITQESFFKALKAIDSFKGNCDIRVWLCQIAKNTYFSYCKKNKIFVSQDEQQEIKDDTSTSMENRLLDKEQSIAIHKILHTLEEPYKEVFHLRTFGELSFKEIGEVFGKSESWSRVTYHRAKMKIVEKL